MLISSSRLNTYSLGLVIHLSVLKVPNIKAQHSKPTVLIALLNCTRFSKAFFLLLLLFYMRKATICSDSSLTGNARQPSEHDRADRLTSHTKQHRNSVLHRRVPLLQSGFLHCPNIIRSCVHSLVFWLNYRQNGYTETKICSCKNIYIYNMRIKIRFIIFG